MQKPITRYRTRPGVAPSWQTTLCAVLLTTFGIGCANVISQDTTEFQAESCSPEEQAVFQAWVNAIIGPKTDDNGVLAPFRRMFEAKGTNEIQAFILERSTVRPEQRDKVLSGYDRATLDDYLRKPQGKVLPIGSVPGAQAKVQLFDRKHYPERPSEFWKEFQKGQPQELRRVYWRVSRVGFNADHTEAMLSFFMVRKGSGGLGYVLYFRKSGGDWKAQNIDHIL